MDLEMWHYPVASMEWGPVTAYDQGRLTIDRDALRAHLEAAGELADLELSTLQLVRPGTATRVINIFDVVAARARLGEGAVDYPGVLGPLQSVGSGRTASLDDFGVLVLSEQPDRYCKLLDMAGAGAALTPQASLCHLAVGARPRRADLSPADYQRGLKCLGLRVGAYLARAAAGSAGPARTTNYTLHPRPVGLPRVAYVCMVASHQRSEAGEPILYGDDVAGLLPTVLHPNELLDGAVVAPLWSMCIDTYSFQNNPVVQALYARHGKEVDFAGVVVNVAHVTRAARERSVILTTNLVQEMLGAELAVLTKVGGGIPESDLMLSIEELERRGVRTAAVVWCHLGDGSAQDSLSVFSPAADALASAGVNDAWVDLPAQDAVVGGNTIGPFTDQPTDGPQPATDPVRLRVRDISGAISQLGASRVTMVEV